jgi:homoserine dehydrogenase
VRVVRLVLIGLGNLGWRFCEILAERRDALCERYGLSFRLVGAADSGGALYGPDGLDPGAIAALKRAGRPVADYGDPAGRPVSQLASGLALVGAAEADVLLEATPVNLDAGAEPGLSHLRAALRRGMHVVTPNKGPLVLAYGELHELAAAHGVQLRYDGTVAGGLPAVNLGARDLRGAELLRIEAVPNLVTGLVMDLLAAGSSWEEALATGRAEGVLETDGVWDLDGWDAAAKLVILVNATAGPYPAARLDDVARTGIGAVDPADLRAATAAGERTRLLARAERGPDGRYALSVAPRRLASDHPLGRLGSHQMGVVFETDLYGTLTAVIDERTPVPSAATMLRDLLDIGLNPTLRV